MCLQLLQSFVCPLWPLALPWRGEPFGCVTGEQQNVFPGSTGTQPSGEFSIGSRVAKTVGYRGGEVVTSLDLEADLWTLSKPGLKSLAEKSTARAVLVLGRFVLTKGDNADRLWPATSTHKPRDYETHLCEGDMKDLVLVQSLTFGTSWCEQSTLHTWFGT